MATMKTRCPLAGRAASVTALLCFATWAPLAFATGPGQDESRAAIEARYRAERQACQDGSSGQEKSVCLKEAGAARAAALNHGLGVAAKPDDYLANALARCQVHAPADRADCERLVRGEGMQSGSVKAGGMIREVTTVTRLR